jgi:hypothetical protein
MAGRWTFFGLRTGVGFRGRGGGLALASTTLARNPGILLPILCAGVQFFLAFDSSRLFTLGFMSMVLSLRYLFNENPFSFRRWAVPVFVLNLAVPAIFTAADQVVVLVPTLVRVFQRL